jgi:hypothetical protein
VPGVYLVNPVPGDMNTGTWPSRLTCLPFKREQRLFTSLSFYNTSMALHLVIHIHCVSTFDYYQRNQYSTMEKVTFTLDIMRYSTQTLNLYLRSVWHILYKAVSCGGGMEYLHHSPARRKRRRKGSQCPGYLGHPVPGEY